MGHSSALSPLSAKRRLVLGSQRSLRRFRLQRCVDPGGQRIPRTWYKQPVFAEAMETVGANILPILEGDTDIAEGLKAIGDQVRELNTRYQ